MENRPLQLYSILVAVSTLFVVATGAYLTGNPAAIGAAAEAAHVWAGSAVAVLAIGLGVWLAMAEKRRWLKNLGWIVVIGFLADAIVGETALQSMPRAAGIFHAVLGLLLFSGVSAIVVFLSPGWNLGPDPVQDYGWPSLRSLAITAPVLVLLQVLAGASYRHKAMGVLTHLLGAMLVALVVLCGCAFVMQQFPKHRALRPAAVMLLSVTGAQVFLGLGAFTM